MSGPYDVVDYGLMTIDRSRTEPYLQALRRVITPDSVVVDIGTGTGFFAAHACTFGARRVYAIEPDETIEVGKEIAAANGYGDRIQFIRDLSTEVQLPERADVVVSDLRGVLPLFDHHLTALVDARERFLAPGGVLIPQRDSMWVALVDAPAMRARHVQPWSHDGTGPDLRAGLRYTLNSYSRARAQPEQLVGVAQSWGTLDYRTLTSPHLEGQVRWTMEAPGTAHGLLMWFDAQVFDDLTFSTAPAAPTQAYGQLFFPFLEALVLAPGDCVEVAISARLRGDYDWGWDTRVIDGRKPDHVKADLRQHTFLGAIFPTNQLKRSEASFIPVIGEKGAIERLVIESMDGQTSIGAIAERLAANFPSRFQTGTEALTLVAELASRLSVADHRTRP